MASRKLIAEWSHDHQVGIWSTTSTIRLYDDRAIFKGGSVRWENNTGSLAHAQRRITGRQHEKLLDLAKQQYLDSADYTADAFDIASTYN